MALYVSINSLHEDTRVFFVTPNIKHEGHKSLAASGDLFANVFPEYN